MFTVKGHHRDFAVFRLRHGGLELHTVRRADAGVVEADFVGDDVMARPSFAAVVGEHLLHAAVMIPANNGGLLGGAKAADSRTFYSCESGL